MDDDGLIHVQCPFDHIGVVILDSRRYEVLLNSAANALLDGYKNEAIAVLSAALERAYEFYLRVVFRAKGLDTSNFESTWKSVSSQSERQIGAFSFIYLLETGRPFEFKSRIPEIRNKIVHKGRIASQAEASEYAELVYECIKHIEDLIEDNYKKAAEVESTHEVEKQKQKVSVNGEPMVMSVKTVVTNESNNETAPTKTFEDYMAAHAQTRTRVH